MGVLKLLILMFVGSVLAGEDNIQIESCNTDDVQCLQKTTEQFFEQTKKGVPAYNIVAIDPLVIPSLDIAYDSDGFIRKDVNLTVTGLRHQNISDFKLDKATKSVVVISEIHLNIESDITVTFTKSGRSLSGHSTSSANVLCTATYNYELKTDDKEVEHYEIGPETSTCKLVDDVTVEYNPEFAQAIANYPDADSYPEEKISELKKKIFLKEAEKAYSCFINNIRAIGKVIPSSQLFKNLH